MSVGTNASGGSRTGIMETELRERLLEGIWHDDCRTEILRHFGPTRQSIIGVPDTSRNVTLRLAERFGVCHQPVPLTTNLDPALAKMIGDHSGFSTWMRYSSLVESLRQRNPELAAQHAMGAGVKTGPMPSTLALLLSNVQRYWYTCNECGVFVGAGDDDIILRRCRPSNLRGIADPERPGVPLLLGWERVHDWGSGPCTTWSVWDIRKPDAPDFTVYAGAKWGENGEPTGEDVTRKVVDVGGYPWRWTQGDRREAPYIPIVLYHKGYPEALFDRDGGSELAQGTLTNAVLYSFCLHSFKDASWPDRNTRGMEVSGSEAADHEEPRAVVSDPSVVHEWRDIDPERPGTQWEWKPGADVEMLFRTQRASEQALEDQFMPPIDMSSTGGDPLAAREKADKERVDQLYPICRQYDSQVLEMCAATGNRLRDTSYPESDYGLLYRSEIADLAELVDSMPSATLNPQDEAPADDMDDDQEDDTAGREE